MADIGIRVSRAAVALFGGNSGLTPAVEALAVEMGIVAPPFRADQVRMSNVAPDLVARTTITRYPEVHVYCERSTNSLKEKFRAFSGTVRMVAEARVSHMAVEGIEQSSHLLADAVTDVLDASRGDWGNGMYFGGRYEVEYGPVKPGGKNFLQITKVTFDVEVSAG
jgi:hypothetical protein